jgi:hypothetical protein
MDDVHGVGVVDRFRDDGNDAGGLAEGEAADFEQVAERDASYEFGNDRRQTIQCLDGVNRDDP